MSSWLSDFDLKKLSIALVAGVYFFFAALHPESWRFIDHVNLLIHEAGHIVFYFFGEFIGILGGTILQLLIPALFVAYFFLRGEFWSASLVTHWLGENFLNVSVYAADAKTMRLNLVVGDIHDWNYLLTETGLIDHAKGVGAIFHGVGFLVILAAIYLSCKASRKTHRQRAHQLNDLGAK